MKPVTLKFGPEKLPELKYFLSFFAFIFGMNLIFAALGLIAGFLANPISREVGKKTSPILVCFVVADIIFSILVTLYKFRLMRYRYIEISDSGLKFFDKKGGKETIKKNVLWAEIVEVRKSHAFVLDRKAASKDWAVSILTNNGMTRTGHVLGPKSISEVESFEAICREKSILVRDYSKGIHPSEEY